MCKESIEDNITPILLKDLGRRYPTENSKQKRRYGLYQCPYCTNEFEEIIANIKNRSVKSCGCLRKTQLSKHNLRYHPLYNIWNGIKTRCLNTKVSDYRHYGARGIKVCDRWLDINNFIEDMYPSYQEGLTLDRIDVDGNYEPDNCRWVTHNVQCRNTRDIRSTNTSGFRGVGYDKRRDKWRARITINTIEIHLGYYSTPLEAAKAYERYVRINNLEHNFTPALTEEEISQYLKGSK